MENEKKKVLLIGNGLNRNKGSILSSVDGMSWDRILKDLAADHGLKDDYDYSGLSYPMTFEIIANYVMKTYGADVKEYPVKKNRNMQNAHSYLKACFSDMVGTFHLNTENRAGTYSAIPKWAFDGKIDAILTTNYEFLIEESILNYKEYDYNENDLEEYTFLSNHRITKKGAKKNHWVKVNGEFVGSVLSDFSRRNGLKPSRDDKKAILERCEMIPLDGDKKMPVYHIHGDINFPSKIVLGHEHYVGMCTLLSGLFKEDEKSIFELEEDSSLHKYGDPKQPRLVKDTWAYKFFTDDIHIIGLALGAAEIDMWWLLTYRAMIIARNGGVGNPENPIKNKIYMYDYVKVAFGEDGKPDPKDKEYLNAQNKIRAMAYYEIEFIPFYLESWDDNDFLEIFEAVERRL